MHEPNNPEDRRIKRYDRSNVAIFRRALAQRPWLGVVLFVLAMLAGAALALGWVGISDARPSDGMRTWVGAALWWLFGVWVGVETLCATQSRDKGQRYPNDIATCSDVDMMSSNADGRFVHKDGSPYSEP